MSGKNLGQPKVILSSRAIASLIPKATPSLERSEIGLSLPESRSPMAAGSNPQAATCTLLAEGAGATEKVGKLFRSRITAITSARASPDQVNVNSQQSIFAHFHDNASAAAATQRHADGRSSR